MSWWQVWSVGLGAITTLMVGTWVVSVVRGDASIVDRVWGVTFVVAAWTYAAAADGAGGRAVLMAVLVTLWGGRLAAYITWRNWGDGEDPRYAAMRHRNPDGFAARSLVTVFLGQGVLAWIISLPLLAVAVDTTPALWTVLDVLAILAWAVGLFFEAVGDWQLARFLRDPANRGTVMDRGLWRYTRHPNYFGDCAVWFGYGLLATAAGAWWAWIGPVVMWLFIVKVSGVALTEQRMGRQKSKREGYDDYVASTNAFFPGPPRERR